MGECPACLGLGRKNPKAHAEAMYTTNSKKRIEAFETHQNRYPKCKKCHGKGKVSYTEHAKAHTNRLVTQNTKPSMVIFRLAPQDYHRFHYAVSGTIVDHYAIPGNLISVNPSAINSESYKVFQENRRYVTVIETTNKRKVFAIPVGAAMVGSIVFENDDGTSTVKKGAKIKAGQLHGKMRFGGSTVVYLFEEDAVDYDEDLMARCTGNWKKKVPCPSITCTLSKIWEDHRNYPAKLRQALATEADKHPCD